LGSTLKKIGDFKSALTMFEKTLEINLIRLSDDDVQFPVLYNNIGLMHFNLEHYENALENYNRALNSGFKSLPNDHNYFAQIYDNIGLVHKTANDKATAIQYFEKSFEIRLKNLPSNHPSIPVIRNMLDEAKQNLEKSE
jgi:tetratricopeptide (TPR) repeat protein